MLIVVSNELCSFNQYKATCADVLLLAQYFYNGVLVCGLIELLENFLRDLGFFKVRSEVQNVLFQVNEIDVCLLQSLTRLIPPPVIEVDVM
jgi:hypothetical protein